MTLDIQPGNTINFRISAYNSKGKNIRRKVIRTGENVVIVRWCGIDLAVLFQEITSVIKKG
jgi:chromosome condensin MukBEF ATPase and DNA-binding subunit MukB